MVERSHKIGIGPQALLPSIEEECVELLSSFVAPTKADVWFLIPLFRNVVATKAGRRVAGRKSDRT